MSLEKMDDLFGVTEMVKKLEDEETAHDVPASEKNDTHDKAEQVEIAPAK